MALLSSVCFKYDKMEGKIASVVMEDVGPDHVFAEGDMVRNNYWLGL